VLRPSEQVFTSSENPGNPTGKNHNNRRKKANNNHRRGGNQTTRTRNLQRKNTLFSPASQGVPHSNKYVPDNQVYKLTQTQVATAVLTTSTTILSTAQRVFQFSFLDQNSSLANVFDQYMIDEIEYILMPRLLTQDGSSLSNAGLVASVIDYDDANSLTTFAQALDYTNCIVGAGIQAHYRCFKPHVAIATYSGAFTSYGNVANQWLDCSSSTVQHYGIKIAAEPTSSALIYDEIVRYHISFRNVR
jgi:hypothetical protein